MPSDSHGLRPDPADVEAVVPDEKAAVDKEATAKDEEAVESLAAAQAEDIIKRPPEPVLIIGGGRVGRALMRRFPTGVVVESDPGKIGQLKDAFGPGRVHHGSGANEEHLLRAGIATARAFVAVTNTDETNHKAVRLAGEHGIPKVIARIEDPEQAPRFVALGAEPVAAPLTACINMITNLLSPERRVIGEGVIADGAPTVGLRIADLALPEGTILVSILRGDHLITPQDSERLMAGDVVTILAEEKERLVPTLTQVTGRDLTLNPLDRLYVPLVRSGAFSTAFREAFVLAQYANAEVFLAVPNGLEELIGEAERLCSLNSVPFQARIFPRKTFLADFVAQVQREDQTDMHGGLKEGMFFECVVVEPQETSLWSRVIGRNFVDRLIKGLDHPVLIARNLKPYKNILLVIDNSSRAALNVAHTIDIALVYGSDITALMPETESGAGANDLLRYLKRAGRIYGVAVHERQVKGNPTLEFIKEVKSGDYDLIVMDWHARSVKRDIIRRVIEYGPRSTLVLP
ncbi:MAG: NAD-binding protein [Euryarchaeota archaeon]|nr:NAD-binding protein [Euryarchaeota archaeon]